MALVYALINLLSTHEDMYNDAYYSHDEADESRKNVKAANHKAARTAERRSRREYEALYTAERCNHVIYVMAKREMDKWNLRF